MATRYTDAMRAADKSRERTSPGPGRANDAENAPTMKTKGIPHASTDRLNRSVEFYHGSIHTAEGIHEWDAPRANMVERGMKIHAITHELALRGQTPGECPLCWPRS